MSTSSRTFEVAALACALALIVLAGYMRYWSMTRMVETASAVERTHVVIEELDALLGATLDAERPASALNCPRNSAPHVHAIAPRADFR